jgi:hypothetical protein
MRTAAQKEKAGGTLPTYFAYALASTLEKLTKEPSIDCSRQNPQVTNQQDGEREHQKKRQPEEIA